MPRFPCVRSSGRERNAPRFRIVEVTALENLAFAPLPTWNRLPAAKRDRIILEGDVPSPIDPPPGCRFAGRCFAKVEGCDCVMPPLEEAKPNHHVACLRYREGGPGKAVV